MTNLADSGTGSLRAAIDIANATPATSDHIVFQSGLTGTVTLASDLPDLLGPTDITGPGMDTLNIDGATKYSMFASLYRLSVSGLTLENAYSLSTGSSIQEGNSDLEVSNTRIKDGYSALSGGGIAVGQGHLTLTDSELSGNRASYGGGLSLLDGSVTISGSVFSGNDVGGGSNTGGAAIMQLHPGTQNTIRNSSFTGNKGGVAAGLEVGGADISIESTLFSGNTASNSVGGLFLGTPSGTGSGSYSVTNSTFFDNSAQAAGAIAVASGGAITVASSTITGNTSTNTAAPVFYQGAGIISLASHTTLSNSIVSGNTPADISANPALTTPTVRPAGSFSGSFDLIGVMPNANFTETVPGSNITSSQPGVSALADNGGPTRTMLPADSSPVVNKGSSALTTDARGLTRPVDFNSIPFSPAVGANGADIGAVELQGGPLPPPAPTNAFSFGWVKLNRKKGVASLQVNVPGAGKVIVAGSRTVAKFSKSAKAKSTVVVTIRAKGKAAKALKKKGKVKVRASVTFTPTGGTTKTRSKSVKLVKAKKKKRR